MDDVRDRVLVEDAFEDGDVLDVTLHPHQRVPLAGVEDGTAFYDIPIKDDTKPVNFIMHLPEGDSVPTTREPGGNRSFVPLEHPEIWLEQGDPAVYFSDPTP